MNENFEGIKKVAISALKKLYKPVIAICIVVILCFWKITMDDASYDDGNNANTPYAVSQYTSDVSISSDGIIEKALTAQELWDKMLEDGSRVDEYLSGPEELQILINAQMVTDYIDTRENPDEEIDWEKINEDVNSKAIQGVIKLKRAQNDGTVSNLKYTDPETFQMYIDNYIESGSEEDKQIALSYFTLEKGYIASTSNVGIIYGTGDFTKYTDLTDAQLQGIANLCKQEQGSLKGAAAEASLMANLFELKNMSSTYGAGGTGLYNYVKNGGWFANAEYYMNNGTADQSYVDVVKAVLVNGKRTIPGYIDEHDCFSDIISATNNGTSITVTDRSQYVPNVTKMANRYTSNYTFYCFPEENSDPFGYTSEGNRTRIGDCYYDFDTGEKVNEQSSTTTSNNNQDVLCWPTLTTETTVSSYFGPRSAPTAGASTNHKGIDISISTGTEIYAMEDGTVTTAAYSDSAGYYIVIDHGNGYISKYMHNSELKVSVGETVSKGDPIAKSGNTGVSTGPHLHFQIEFNGNAVDPLSFKYNNGMGNGVGGTGSDINSLSTTTVFYAKVATWNEMTDIIESDDPAVENKNETTYNMTTTSINYQQLVSGYKMPFDYLWAWIVMSQDKDFVFELADLVYDSEIEITVHDNLTINTNVSTDTYTNKTKVITDNVNVKVIYQDSQSAGSGALASAPTTHSVTVTGGPFKDETEESYKTVHTIITETNTLNVGLTKANVWIVNYAQEFIQETLDPVVITSTANYDEEYPETPDKTDDQDALGLAEQYRQSVKQQYEQIYTNVNASIESLVSDYYYKTVNGTVIIDNKTEKTDYIEQTPVIEEKTDKEASEPNFVNILLRYRKVRNNINSASSWLFEILESGPNTVDMLELTKYLLYKTTGKIYDGVDEFDFEQAFNPKNFKTLDAQYGGASNIEGIPGQIYDFLLAKGVPPIGAAAVVANIENESSFDPTVVNSIGCSGLCQWYHGRLDNLKNLASSRGVDWTNVDIQLEYMWNELEGSYASVKNVIMSATTEADLEYATWYWGRYYEVYMVGDFESTKNNAEPRERYEDAKKWYNEWQQKHSTGFTGSALAVANGTSDEKLAFLFPNGLPQTDAQARQYMVSVTVALTRKDGVKTTGTMTVHKAVASDVQEVFQIAQNAGFKIYSAYAYSWRQMNNGGSNRSHHSYGIAIDLNVDENYSHRGSTVYAGSFWDPSRSEYSIPKDGVLVNAFKAKGWKWGGDWSGNYQDYMHFSFTGK